MKQVGVVVVVAVVVSLAGRSALAQGRTPAGLRLAVAPEALLASGADSAAGLRERAAERRTVGGVIALAGLGVTAIGILTFVLEDSPCDGPGLWCQSPEAIGVATGLVGGAIGLVGLAVLASAGNLEERAQQLERQRLFLAPWVTRGPRGSVGITLQVR